MSGERCSLEWGEVSPVLFDRTGPEWCVVGLLTVCAPEHYGGNHQVLVLGEISDGEKSVRRKIG